MWQQYTNALLGLCVLAVAFINLDAATLQWTLGILGAVIAVLGLWGAGALSSLGSGQEPSVSSGRALG